MRNGRLGLLCILLTLALWGCEQAPPSAIRFGLATMPANLNPLYASDAASERINRLLYRSLTDFDAQSRPVPSLASWQRISDRRYRFTLIEGDVRFHHGRPLSAEDVVATYRAILDPGKASPHKGSFAHLSRVEAVDERRIDFVLSRPAPLFAALTNIGILPADLLAAGHDFAANPIGSGPLRFLDRPEPGRLRLQRIADEQVLSFVHVPEPTVRALKLLAGELDLIQNDLPPELVEFLRQQPGLNLTRMAGSTFAYVGFNLQDPISGDRRIRQAIAHAIDRETIIRYLFNDGAEPAESLLLPEHWAGTDKLLGYDYDPDKAQALLAELGYTPDNPLPIGYKTSTDPFRLRVATVFQAQLAEVGIRLDIQSHDWGTFFGDIKAGRFQMYSLSWVGIRSPDVLRYIFHSDSIPPVGANRGRYRSQQVDRWLDEAAESAAPGLFRQVQSQVHQDLVYVPLWYEGHVLVRRDDITGYELRRDGAYDGLARVKRTAMQ